MKEAVESKTAGHTHESGSELCVFCDIIRGIGEASVIARHKNALAIMDLHNYPLVIPDSHITDINEVNISKVHDTYELAHRIEAVIRKNDPDAGVILFTNRGESAGQEIEHFHVHALIQRAGERKLRLNNVFQVSREVLDDHAAELRVLYEAAFSSQQDRVVINSDK